ncbi:hypothetical protein [Heliorestis convoluta]|uniref:DUF305 domain-containing protein n=1 Tax=Heliorestis convoluta TaxID=356322 RepID=A0A5Q2MZ33_9FIRM|nr:hypothetical protein [Heliorestis convoluta]QGG46182.1 hypothetical protein FTV88_0003 [Heliorestis convoluta]
MKKLIAVGLIGMALGAGFFQISTASAETEQAPRGAGAMHGMMSEKAGWMSDMMGPMHNKMMTMHQKMMGDRMDTPEGQAMIEACNAFWARQNTQQDL